MATLTIPPRPPALPIAKVCNYKRIGETLIPIDVYVPKAPGAACPIMLFIHGGGWLGGSRSDYCRPLFQQFLSLGFVVTSMDYRLRPETSLDGQLEDVRDVETWLRNSLAPNLFDRAVRVNADKIIVVGASAGAHLALLTPKLWRKQPTAILSMYGPTDMHKLPPLRGGRFSAFPAPPATPALLAAAIFEVPPTDFPPPKTVVDYLRPRSSMATRVFADDLVMEFLIKGLQRDEMGQLMLPQQGCVSEEEIDAISPIKLVQHINYPPVCQVMGVMDDIFDVSHAHDFYDVLRSRGVKCQKIILSHKTHAFDIWEEIGGDLDKKVIGPAVEWVVQNME